MIHHPHELCVPLFNRHDESVGISERTCRLGTARHFMDLAHSQISGVKHRSARGLFSEQMRSEELYGLLKREPADIFVAFLQLGGNFDHRELYFAERIGSRGAIRTRHFPDQMAHLVALGRLHCPMKLPRWLADLDRSVSHLPCGADGRVIVSAEQTHRYQRFLRRLHQCLHRIDPELPLVQDLNEEIAAITEASLPATADNYVVHQLMFSAGLCRRLAEDLYSTPRSDKKSWPPEIARVVLDDEELWINGDGFTMVTVRDGCVNSPIAEAAFRLGGSRR